MGRIKDLLIEEQEKYCPMCKKEELEWVEKNIKKCWRCGYKEKYPYKK